ncbi:Sec-independent protein translocase protein TatB [Pantoea sp. B65]|uniref:Sec-independent protein translocase protein TatB n=1 Tax=Pantoea sp. B65 TaxID=2813359 RepID=UPI0039B5FFBC
MFDIGFSELVLVFVIGLVVLGPQRLPVAVRTVVGWIRALRSLASSVQNELAQELKLQELQDSLRKVEQASKDSLSPELKESMEELKKTAESMKRSYLGDNEKADDEANTIHNPLVKDPKESHEGVTPAEAGAQASAPVQVPDAVDPVVKAEPAIKVDSVVTPEPAAARAPVSTTQPSGER